MSERIIIKARLHYPHVFAPRTTKWEDGSTTQSYSACLLIPKTDVDTAALVKKSMEEEAVESHKAMLQRMSDAKVTPQTALRDGDKPNSVGNVVDDFKGCWVLDTNTSFPPDLLQRDSTDAIEGEHLYAGAYVRARISPYGSESEDEPGLRMRFNLHILQHIKDLPKFDVAPNASEIMGVYEDEDEDVEALFGITKE